MKKLLLVCVLVVFGLMVGCATTPTAVKEAPKYTFVIMPSKAIDVPVEGGQKVTFNPSEVLKKALMAEYKDQAAFVDGTSGPSGAIIVEPRSTDIWKRGPVVKEGVATGYVNKKWVAGYFGEMDGAISASDAKTKIEGAAENFAKKVRFEIAP